MSRHRKTFKSIYSLVNANNIRYNFSFKPDIDKTFKLYYYILLYILHIISMFNYFFIH